MSTAMAPATMPSTSTGKKPRVFSGIQPSGSLHIGNYLGAIRNWVIEQEQYENIFCVVDMHAITLPQDPTNLRQRTREVAALYIASGIKLEHAAVIAQSDIDEHPALAWIFNCITPMGWLNRMTQFKSKAGDDRESVSVGLYDYPVLMAADILLYNADFVPVGDDQRQHVELTRDIAEKFNNTFGQTFVVPSANIKAAGARIMGLDDPTKKMSKSDPGSNHAILMADDEDATRRKIMRATTDSGREVRFDPERPGIYNLLTIYQLFSGQSPEEIEARFAGKGYGDFKKELAELVIESLRPIRAEFHRLIDEPGHIEEVFYASAARVRPIAAATLADVKRKVGLGG
jgi:tryptophanyl-tRNA synthetase